MDYNYISFVPGVEAPQEHSNSDLWFVFDKNKLIIREINDKVEIPVYSDIEKYYSRFKHVHYLGSLRGTHCYAGEMETPDIIDSAMRFSDLRATMPFLDEEIFLICGKAIQIINWDKDHKFCGRCGSLMKAKGDERAKVCPDCGFTNYPRISPATITAVTKGDKLLMAHNNNFKPGLYSMVAGFVEAGETFEECVKREVMEEVGVKVKNIKYFKSQPWPFPNSIMIAFTAEYDGGEVTPDGVEIGDAGWYTKDNMPSIPPKGSVARKLIEWFLTEYKPE